MLAFAEQDRGSALCNRDGCLRYRLPELGIMAEKDARSVPALLARTLPSFERKPLMSFARMASVSLRGERDAEQIEGAALGLGGGGKDGGEAIAPKADDIAGERGEIAKQGMEAVHREWFAIC